MASMQGADGAGEKKRKRVAPVMVAQRDGTAPAPPTAVAGEVAGAGGAASSSSGALPPEVDAQAAEPSMVWAADPESSWEVWAEPTDSENDTLVRGLRDGDTVWQHVVCSRVQHAALGGGFAALAAGLELHVLSASSGRMVLPPLVMGSAFLLLALTSGGHLAALLRDASLMVWDLNALSCTVQTSLLTLCQPADVELLELRPKTGEPFLLLLDGRLLLFQRDLKAWVTLSQASGVAPLPEAPSPANPRAALDGLGDGLQLENDLLVAACLGDPEEFRERLELLVQSYGEHEIDRLRSWCAALLGRCVGTTAAWSWLADQLPGMGLEGDELLRDVVIPGLGAGMPPAAQELRAELQELLSSQQVVSIL